jgi:hypothetical protein
MKNDVEVPQCPICQEPFVAGMKLVVVQRCGTCSNQPSKQMSLSTNRPCIMQGVLKKAFCHISSERVSYVSD